MNSLSTFRKLNTIFCIHDFCKNLTSQVLLFSKGLEIVHIPVFLLPTSAVELASKFELSISIFTNLPIIKIIRNTTDFKYSL